VPVNVLVILLLLLLLLLLLFLQLMSWSSVIQAGVRATAGLVQRIVASTAKVLVDLGRMPTARLELPDILVGLHTRLEHVLQLMTFQGSSRMVVLTGVEGIGKTTLAKAAYNFLTRHDPTLPCRFVQLEPDMGAAGIAAAQSGLLAAVVHAMREAGEGPVQLASALRGVKVLLVVDGAQDNQLALLLPKNIMEVLGEGSMVLVTSRDAAVAEGFGGKRWVETVAMEALSEDQSMELFCKHAFGSSTVPTDEKELMRQAVGKCGGVPKGLTFLGKKRSSSRSKEEFRKEVEGWMPYSGATASAAFQASWNQLDQLSRESLVDIAWFLKGQRWDMVESCCDNLEELCDLGLVKRHWATDGAGQPASHVELADGLAAFCKSMGPLSGSRDQELTHNATVNVHPAVADFCKLAVRFSGCSITYLLYLTSYLLCHTRPYTTWIPIKNLNS
jgi:hypothetical protein